jgi:hypothetical protein
MADRNGWARGPWQVLAAAAGLGLLVNGTGTAAAQPPVEGARLEAAARTTVVPAEGVANVRGLRVGRFDAGALVDAAKAVCPTVQRLLDTLQHTDVMVLVEVRDQVLNRTGHLRFIGAGNGRRWVRITIDGGNRQAEQAGWLAHELRHAVEVAAAPNVTDAKELERLYVRIGTNMGNGQFETDAAIAAGKQALDEAYAPKRRHP